MDVGFVRCRVLVCGCLLIEKGQVGGCQGWKRWRRRDVETKTQRSFWDALRSSWARSAREVRGKLLALLVVFVSVVDLLDIGRNQTLFFLMLFLLRLISFHLRSLTWSSRWCRLSRLTVRQQGVLLSQGSCSLRGRVDDWRSWWSVSTLPALSVKTSFPPATPGGLLAGKWERCRCRSGCC